MGPLLPNGPKGPTARGSQSTPPNATRPTRGRRRNDTPRAALLSGTGREKRNRRGKCGGVPNGRDDRTRPPRFTAQKAFSPCGDSVAPFWPSKRTISLWLLFWLFLWLYRNEPRSPIQALGDDGFIGAGTRPDAP